MHLSIFNVGVALLAIGACFLDSSFYPWAHYAQSHTSELISLNVFAFIIYGLDKLFAVKGLRRVPENFLLLTAILGGWIGGLLGQSAFRHKVSKMKFIIPFWVALGINIGVSFAMLY